MLQIASSSITRARYGLRRYIATLNILGSRCPHSSMSGCCRLALRCLIGRGGRSESIAPVRLNYWPQELTPRYPISSNSHKKKNLLQLSSSATLLQLFRRNNARPPSSCPICDWNLIEKSNIYPDIQKKLIYIQYVQTTSSQALKLR